MPHIKTPDQRIRVFISSTIQELAEERKAAREAISNLRLIPVFFEGGARPHPPKDLYRAYLEQSQVFIGIYYVSYGWTAPGMDISGLEDEYRLSGDKPKLIYIKRTASERQDGLKQLLSFIQKADKVSYKNFDTDQELKNLIENDLALLLSEKFESTTLSDKKQTNSSLFNTIPVHHDRLLGREKELANLKEMLENPEISLVTITGTGGTGKTRMAIQLAEELKESFPDGIYFESLTSITDPGSLISAIAHAVGVYDNGKQDIFDTLVEWLADKQSLLILDNFEQLIDAGKTVSRILNICPAIKFLVTSRIPLRVREEHVFPLHPLATPERLDQISAAEIQEFPSVKLFIKRAREVNPSMQIDEKNVRAIAEITNQLDGLPLAIELAAIKARYLPPVELSGRMKKALDILSRGHRDLPERQQTMRATLEWSYNLLDDNGKGVFRRLAIFHDGWTLDAADQVVLKDSGIDTGIMEAIENLVDHGLIIPGRNAGDNANPRFTMLQVIKEYALEMLAASGEIEQVSGNHSVYFLGIAEKVVSEMWESEWMNMSVVLELDYHNFTAAFSYALTMKNNENALKILAFICMLSVTCGRITEAMQSLESADITGIFNSPDCDQSISTQTKAYIFQASGLLRFFASDFRGAVVDFDKSIDFFEKAGDAREKVRNLIWRGLSGLSLQDFSSIRFLNEGIEGAERFNDIFNLVIGKNFLAEAFLAMNDFDKVKILLDETETRSRSANLQLLLAASLIQKGNLLLTIGDIDEAEMKYRESILLFNTITIKSVKGWAHIGLGFTLMKKNEWPEANGQFLLGLNAGREAGDKSIVVGALTGLAGVACENGNKKTAAKLLGVADAQAPLSGFIARQLSEFVNAAVKQKLGEELFSKEFLSGRNISFDKAIRDLI